jgi:hypothetical protein
MANRHSKLHAVDLEETPGVSGHIELIFGRVELVLGLASLNLAPGVNDISGNLPACRRDSFHPEDSGCLIRSCPLCHGLKNPFLVSLIKRKYLKILSPKTRKIGFWETHDLRAMGRSFGQEPLDLVQAFVKG